MIKDSCLLPLVLQRFFRGDSISAFYRQLFLYGFRKYRNIKGSKKINYECFFHRKFKRGRIGFIPRQRRERKNKEEKMSEVIDEQSCQKDQMKKLRNSYNDLKRRFNEKENDMMKLNKQNIYLLKQKEEIEDMRNEREREFAIEVEKFLNLAFQSIKEKRSMCLTKTIVFIEKISEMKIGCLEKNSTNTIIKRMINCILNNKKKKTIIFAFITNLLKEKRKEEKRSACSLQCKKEFFSKDKKSSSKAANKNSVISTLKRFRGFKLVFLYV